MAFDRRVYVVLCVLGFAAGPAVAGDDPATIELGRQLFERSWLRLPADDSPLALAPGGDGLGPLFNGASCVECHRQGGVGGAGPNEHNVEIVSLVVPLDIARPILRELVRSARHTHSGFRADTNVFLHRFGVDRDGSKTPYEDFRGGIRSAFPEHVLPASETETTLSDGLRYQLAQRNTPALWGAGRLEDIPARVVDDVAARQKRDTPAMAGLVIDKAGVRFGWRGQTATLQQFVRDACANELGMRVRGRDTFHDQPEWPLKDERASRASSGKGDQPVDLSATQVTALVAFVRSLPAPKQVVPDDIAQQVAADAGRKHFESIGCALCHVPDMGGVAGVYSDMLLHDMGPTFADRVAAPLDEAQPRSVTQAGTTFTQISSSGSYGGGGIRTVVRTTPTTVIVPPSLGALTKATQAFRTPPLWGVADSAPYLHDGRAATLDEAIRLHAGQAAEVADRYAGLGPQSRNELLAFLGTLRAPQVD